MCGYNILKCMTGWSENWLTLILHSVQAGIGLISLNLNDNRSTSNINYVNYITKTMTS